MDTTTRFSLLTALLLALTGCAAEVDGEEEEGETVDSSEDALAASSNLLANGGFEKNDLIQAKWADVTSPGVWGVNSNYLGGCSRAQRFVDGRFAAAGKAYLIVMPSETNTASAAQLVTARAGKTYRLRVANNAYDPPNQSDQLLYLDFLDADKKLLERAKASVKRAKGDWVRSAVRAKAPPRTKFLRTGVFAPKGDGCVGAGYDPTVAYDKVTLNVVD